MNTYTQNIQTKLSQHLNGLCESSFIPTKVRTLAETRARTQCVREIRKQIARTHTCFGKNKPHQRARTSRTLFTAASFGCFRRQHGARKTTQTWNCPRHSHVTFPHWNRFSGAGWLNRWHRIQRGFESVLRVEFCL